MSNDPKFEVIGDAPDKHGPDVKEAYISTLKERTTEYRHIGRKMRRRFLQLRLIAAVGSITIPILSNMPLTWSNFDVAKAGTTFLGFVVALSIAFEGILKYRDRMPAFSNTARILESELAFYSAGAKEYQGKHEPEAFQLFVERCEAALTVMRQSTLGALTRVDDPDPHR